LLSTFGSVQRIASLSAEELQKAPGIGPVQAAKILKFLTETPVPEAPAPKNTVELVRVERPLGIPVPETAKYRWNETIDVPYRETPPATNEERSATRAVRRTYDPKRKRGIHRA
ncbi:MAG: helix-hairpin-helix domain-containing protein, partial [Pyramidobacter sp.]|nr:helix-hairpin-helix domain-containing protein [Pyramidobacter sp.]